MALVAALALCRLKAGSPVISDRALDRGELTEGSLGGRLAQRLAALREVMAAGARLTSSCLPIYSSALAVPRAAQKSKARSAKRRADAEWRHAKSKKGKALITLCPSHSALGSLPLRSAHRHLPLQRDRFLVSWIESHGARRVLACFTEVSALKKDSAEQNVRIDRLRGRIPEDRRLQGRNGCFLIATPLVDPAAQKKRFGICRFRSPAAFESRPSLHRRDPADTARESCSELLQCYRLWLAR